MKEIENFILLACQATALDTCQFSVAQCSVRIMYPLLFGLSL